MAVRDWVVQRATVSGHDWSRTLGFGLLADRAGYIGLNGRAGEAEGSLPAGSAEEQRHGHARGDFL